MVGAPREPARVQACRLLCACNLSGRAGVAADVDPTET